jgi:hypothetical protein
MRLCLCRFNVTAFGALEGVQFVAGLFRLAAKEPRQCSAFGTAGPFNGIGMWRAWLVGGHSGCWAHKEQDGLKNRLECPRTANSSGHTATFVADAH